MGICDNSGLIICPVLKNGSYCLHQREAAELDPSHGAY